MNNRFLPNVASCRHHQQGAAMSVSPHRRSQLHEHVYRVVPGRRRSESRQRLEQIRTIGKTGSFFVHNLRLFAFEHRDISKLSEAVDAPVLDHQQPWLNVLKDETEAGNRAGGAPYIEFVSLMPNAE